jgi:hypothetical protein
MRKDIGDMVTAYERAANNPIAEKIRQLDLEMVRREKEKHNSNNTLQYLPKQKTVIKEYATDERLQDITKYLSHLSEQLSNIPEVSRHSEILLDAAAQLEALYRG